MEIIAIKATDRGWVAVVDGPEIPELAINDRLGVPPEAGDGRYRARLRVLRTGDFPVCHVTRVPGDVDAMGLVGEQVVRC